MLLRHSVSPFHNGSVYTISSILWLSRSLEAPLSSHSDVCHISCATLIRHRLILIYMLASAFSATLQLYLRSAQLDTADFRYRRLGDTALCCHGRASVAHIPPVSLLIWAEFKRCLHSLSFHLSSTVPHVDLPEHLSDLL